MPTDRMAATRNPTPEGYTRDARAIVCSVIKGVHRWADPFHDGDTCACGALYLTAHPQSAAAFEVHDG